MDQGQVIKYFCRISLVMYLVYYNFSNARPECQAKLIVALSPTNATKTTIKSLKVCRIPETDKFLNTVQKYIPPKRMVSGVYWK